MAARIIKRVLVVDDDPILRAAVADHLEGYGLEPVLASDGAEALGLLSKGPRPAAILLDVLMPRMGGRDFVARLRRVSRLTRIPIVIMTGLTRRAPLPRVDEVLAKPFGAEQLRATLVRVGALPPPKLRNRPGKVSSHLAGR
ncbi:response regulator [Anaeromyxobacter paludicola]|uniref:Response regulatory domain-containing protein n=1 Tax=Anaeromyxobacter paludicola TaxID=2918171 RepID=A0ABN6N8X4_9BACT|nr:response regulator [Anaeromyxobacter paludicola]BDG08392.1 hypothetical protein AMPC_15050 [Anaeromyxobacter paludicola]